MQRLTVETSLTNTLKVLSIPLGKVSPEVISAIKFNALEDLRLPCSISMEYGEPLLRSFPVGGRAHRPCTMPASAHQHPRQPPRPASFPPTHPHAPPGVCSGIELPDPYDSDPGQVELPYDDCLVMLPQNSASLRRLDVSGVLDYGGMKYCFGWPTVQKMGELGVQVEVGKQEAW